MQRLVLSMALMAAAGAAMSDDAEQEGWTGVGEFGLVVARGNSETETINGKLDLGRRTTQWEHALGLVALRSQESGTVSAERYVGTARSRYSLSERSYSYGALRYEDDRFSGYDYQATLSAGYGIRILDAEDRAWSLEGGPGYRRARLSTGESEGELILRGQSEYRWQLTETTEFTNRTLLETGDDNTLAENEAGLSVRMNSRLSLKLGFALRHNTEVPVGRKKTDTLSTVNLVYAF